MTITALVVLTMALAAEKGGPVARPATPGSDESPASGRAGVTCALSVVRVSPTFDVGIFAPRPRQVGDAVVVDDAMVRDSVSACAGASTRRVSGAGTGER